MADPKRDEFYYGKFPDDFVWSTATASYQIEGAVNEDGRGVSIWDTFSRTEGKVYKGHTGDVACDSYHKYEEDIQLMKNLGTSHYRFSIAWPRIMPNGRKDSLNQKGIDFYNKFIDALVAAGIQPMVTLYHWDLPQTLQDIGGWPNEELVDLFADYAEVCYKNFGDRVKSWITFNEPICTVWLGYGNGVHAPGIKDPLNSAFKAAHTLLKSHAKAWHLYDEKFRATQKGVCGITINTDWDEPKDPNNPDDVEAAAKLLEFKLGWYANPIFGTNGDYPETLKQQLKAKASSLGLEKSPLPEFTPAEVKYIKGTSDFFGLNQYTSRLCSKPTAPMEPTSEAGLMDVQEDLDPSWSRGESVWLYVVPWGLRRILKWIKDKYNDPPIYVTENGISDGDGTVNDPHRVDYYRRYINEVLKAIRLDGVNVKGYTAWSLLDNYEWAEGYREKFGLHYVDFDDPKRPRKPKASAKFYSEVIANNGFPSPK